VNFCWPRTIDLINNMIVSIDKHPLMLQLVILLSIKTDFVTDYVNFESTPTI